MKIYISIIILLIIVIVSNLLLQKKIERFYTELPDYVEEQNDRLTTLQKQNTNNTNDIMEVNDTSNQAIIDTTQALKQLKKTSSNTKRAVSVIALQHRILQDKINVLERKKLYKINTPKNRRNHTIIFYEHRNYKGRPRQYRIPQKGKGKLRINLCPKIGRKNRCDKSYNDKWSSVKIPQNTELKVWEHIWKGRNGKFTNNISDLHSDKLGDKITTFEVKKTENDVLLPTYGF